MNNVLKKTFENSLLVVHSEKYVLAKVKTLPALDKHFFISRDLDEITVLTKKINIEELDLIEASSERSLLEIQFLDSLDSPGFLAALSTALSKEGISISVISTYSKDYLLIKYEVIQKAVEILSNLGLKSNTQHG